MEAFIFKKSIEHLFTKIVSAILRIAHMQKRGNFLVVQWLGLGAFTAMAWSGNSDLASYVG